MLPWGPRDIVTKFRYYSDVSSSPLSLLSIDIALHQDAYGYVASNENPVWSALHREAKWLAAFGELAAPYPPWKETRSDGSQMHIMSPECHSPNNPQEP